MEISYSYSDQGTKEYNEDLYGCCGNFAWVIDGSTSVFGNPITGANDTLWLIHQLNSTISNQILKHPDLSPFEILKRCMKKIYDRLLKKDRKVIEQLEEYELPHFAFSMVKAGEGRCEYVVLGDCSLFVKQGENIYVFEDHRIDAFVERNRKAIDKIRKEKSKELDIPPEYINMEKERNEIYKETRKDANTENGYWIGSITGKGIDKALYGKVKLEKKVPYQVLLFTDGFKDYEQIWGKDKLKECEWNDEQMRYLTYHMIYTEPKYIGDFPVPYNKARDNTTVVLLDIR